MAHVVFQSSSEAMRIYSTRFTQHGLSTYLTGQPRYITQGVRGSGENTQSANKTIQKVRPRSGTLKHNLINTGECAPGQITRNGKSGDEKEKAHDQNRAEFPLRSK